MTRRRSIVSLTLIGLRSLQAQTVEVATIKPHNPAIQGFGINFSGREFNAVNVSLSDLIAFAWVLHPRQIAAAPAWVEGDKYDVNALSTADGKPALEPMRIMVRDLLTDRFRLSFHRKTKSLSVYTIVTAKSGPKFLSTPGDPDADPSYGFRGLGLMTVRNAAIADFAGWMQRYVLDRPVLDRTTIPGRYNFNLRWTPDDSQFGDRAGLLPPQSGNFEQPDLYTALQQQLGLKLESTKAPVEVFVIDHAEKPSAN